MEESDYGHHFQCNNLHIVQLLKSYEHEGHMHFVYVTTRILKSGYLLKYQHFPRPTLLVHS